MNVLAVETSAKSTGVSIIADKKVVSEFNVNAKLTHSQTLMPMVEAALACADFSLDAIDAFAVSCGPGSFTGLRIGIGAIKGMAYALEKPCISVSTLQALATNLVGYDGIICPVMDARCAQVYTALFKADLMGKLTRLSPDEAITIIALKERLSRIDKNIFLVGDGAELCYNQLKADISNLFLASAAVRFQKATSVGIIGCAELAENSSVCTAAELMPHYLRLPQAERERLSRITNRCP